MTVQPWCMEYAQMSTHSLACRVSRSAESSSCRVCTHSSCTVSPVRNKALFVYLSVLLLDLPLTSPLPLTLSCPPHILLSPRLTHRSCAACSSWDRACHRNVTGRHWWVSGLTDEAALLFPSTSLACTETPVVRGSTAHAIKLQPYRYNTSCWRLQ